jgi:hypothetical protein
MAHEDLKRTHHVNGSSDRSFGLVFAAVFLLISLEPLLSGLMPRYWSLAVAATFALMALVRPALLAMPNRIWMRFGLLLGHIVSPVALGILFYGVFALLGATLRLMGKDPLRLRREPAATSYWVPREPPGPPPGSFANPF